MDIQTYLAKLNYQPIDTLPWIEENFACEDEEPDIRRHMPCGVILKRTSGEYVTIGNNTSGRNTRGCDCCSSEWVDVIDRYTHWAWVWDVKE